MVGNDEACVPPRGIASIPDKDCRTTGEDEKVVVCVENGDARVGVYELGGVEGASAPVVVCKWDLTQFLNWRDACIVQDLSLEIIELIRYKNMVSHTA